MKLVAIHSIHRCTSPGEAKINEETGKVGIKKMAGVEIVKPGKIFEATEKEAKELLDRKAARRASDRDVKAAQLGLTISPNGGPAVISESAPSGDDNGDDDGEGSFDDETDTAPAKTGRRKV